MRRPLRSRQASKRAATVRISTKRVSVPRAAKRVVLPARGCPPGAEHAMLQAYLLVLREVHAELLRDLHVADAEDNRIRWNGKFQTAEQWVQKATSTIKSSVDEDLHTLPVVAGARLAGTQELVDQFRARNVHLIKTVAEEHIATVDRIVSENAGLHVEGLQKKLQETLEISESKAKFWAVDQTLKLHADIVQTQHERLGIEEYDWITSKDGTVREDHAKLEGKRFRYDNPPVTNQSQVDRGQAPRRCNPGKDYRCRCHADPVLPTLAKQPAPAPGPAPRPVQPAPAPAPAPRPVQPAPAPAPAPRPVQPAPAPAPAPRPVQPQPRQDDLVTFNSPLGGPTFSEVPQQIQGIPQRGRGEPIPAPRPRPEQPMHVAPLPEVLPMREGTPVLPEPWIPKRPEPVEPHAKILGAEIRRNSQAADQKFVGRLREELKPSPALARRNAAYMQRQFSELVDADAQKGLRTFTDLRDFTTMRKYMRGESRDSLIQGLLEEMPEAEAIASVDRAIRATHEMERAFRQAEDSPIKTVYRGLGGFTDTTLEHLLGSEIYSMRGAMSSTSSEFHVGLNFAEVASEEKQGHGVVLALERKTKAISIEAIAEYEHEHEVIVHGNTQWRITGRERLADYFGREMWLIHAVEVL